MTMARAGLTDHHKFCRLVHLLKEPVPHVWGYLECLWKAAYQRRSDYIGDEVDVELAAMYPGEAGKLVKALEATRFIDKREDSFYVHDLADHAPPYVRRGLERKSTSGRPKVNHKSTSGQQENREREENREGSKRGSDDPPPTPPKKGKAFHPPTFEEVRAYCEERGNGINPQRFIDHYQAAGWKRKGGVKVTDWKACVRTWEGNEFNPKPAADSPHKPASNDMSRYIGD